MTTLRDRTAKFEAAQDQATITFGSDRLIAIILVKGL